MITIERDSYITGYDIVGPREVPFSVTRFPGGEINVSIENVHQILSRRDTCSIKANITCSDDLMTVLLLKDVLDRHVSGVSLFMPYMPYARQDRVCNPGESLTLKVICNIINAANFTSVKVLDPHSDVTVALLDYVESADSFPLVYAALQRMNLWAPIATGGGFKEFNIIVPDAGAAKKTDKLAQYLRDMNVRDFNIVQCLKKRDTKTGKLSGFEVPSSMRVCPSLIYDDICDGGGTFLGIKEALDKEYKAIMDIKGITLVVTHGIFSQGFEKLSRAFNNIVYTDSFKTHPDRPANCFEYTTEFKPKD